MFWRKRSPDPRGMEDDLSSDAVEVRARAVQELLEEARENPAIRERALRLFHEAAVAARDPLTACHAVLGIEFLAGSEAARPRWLALLGHPDDRISASAVFALTDPSYAPALIELLDPIQERGPRVREAALRGLGRMKHESSLPAILAHLSDPATRPSAIIALEQLENPAAIPFLEPLLRDQSPSGMPDDRGVPLSIADLAGYAVRRLKYLAGDG